MPGDIYRTADLDHSSRVPPNQLGYIKIFGVQYPLKLLGEWVAADPLVGAGHGLIFHEGNLFTLSGILYLCVTKTTSGPPGVDWRVFDQSYFALRADRVWDGGMPIFVGTAGVDGVDALLTPESPPFENGWTNVLGSFAPVSFVRTVTGWIHLSGAPAGGADGSTIFTLPVDFRPTAQQPHVVGTNQVNHIATYSILSTGAVVMGTII